MAEAVGHFDRIEYVSFEGEGVVIASADAQQLAQMIDAIVVKPEHRRVFERNNGTEMVGELKGPEPNRHQESCGGSRTTQSRLLFALALLLGIAAEIYVFLLRGN